MTSADLYAAGFCVYEIDPKTENDIRIVGFGHNLAVAEAAYNAALTAMPGSMIQLRNRAQVIRQEHSAARPR